MGLRESSGCEAVMIAIARPSPRLALSTLGWLPEAANLAIDHVENPQILNDPINPIGSRCGYSKPVSAQVGGG